MSCLTNCNDCTIAVPKIPSCFSGVLTIGYVTELAANVVVLIEKASGIGEIAEVTTTAAGLVTIDLSTETQFDDFFTEVAGAYGLHILDDNGDELPIYPDGTFTSGEEVDCLLLNFKDTGDVSGTVTAISLSFTV